MFYNKQLKRNVKALDVRISKLYNELDKPSLMNRQPKTDAERKQIVEQIKDLADLRDKLSESKTRESLLPIMVPAAVGLTAMFMVIRHEETNVITTKALGLAQKFIRGGQ